MIISERIFYVMEQKNITQLELSRRTGIATSNISDWKKKKTNPKADCLLSICDALDITPEQLLTGKGIDPEYKDADMDYEVTRADIKILKHTATPTSVCSAMSQGYIGYDLQNAIRTELLNRGIYKTVSTVLTQVVVDPYDEAFYHPTKVIGRVMTKEEAEEEEKKGNHVTEVEGGYRRIVASPKPMDIVEIDAISALSDADQVVIACGGGGIPVLAQNNRLQGASAVIEKDLAAGKLAELLDADMLAIRN